MLSVDEDEVEAQRRLDPCDGERGDRETSTQKDLARVDRIHEAERLIERVCSAVASRTVARCETVRTHRHGSLAC